MNKALRLPDYLGHILEAIERIEEYVSDMDEMAFLASKLVQDAVCRNIEIIGEASNNIIRAARPHSMAGDVCHAQSGFARLRQSGL